MFFRMGASALARGSAPIGLFRPSDEIAPPTESFFRSAPMPPASRDKARPLRCFRRGRRHAMQGIASRGLPKKFFAQWHNPASAIRACEPVSGSHRRPFCGHKTFSCGKKLRCEIYLVTATDDSGINCMCPRSGEHVQHLCDTDISKKG